MWTLTNLYAQNLCSFRELSFEIQQGVTSLIFGDNRDNESQRSNGSGKSALIECIALGITGSPLRKVKNEEIINDNSDECFIQLHFQNTSIDETFTVERKIYRKGTTNVSCQIIRNGVTTNEAIQHSVDAYNKYILEKLGITKDELYNNFILSKFKYQDFLSSSDKDKKDIINRFSNGILVDQAINKVLDDIKPVEECLKNEELELAGVDGRISLLTEQIEKEKSLQDEKAITRKERIAEIENTIAQKRLFVRCKSEDSEKLVDEYEQIKQADDKIQELEQQDLSLEEYQTEIQGFLNSIPLVKMTDWSLLIKAKKDKIAEEIGQLNKWNDEFTAIENEVHAANAVYDKLNEENETFLKETLSKNNTYNTKLSDLEKQYHTRIADIEKLKTTRKAQNQSIESINNKLAGVIVCPSCSFEFILSDKDFDVEAAKEFVDIEKQKGLELYDTISKGLTEIEFIEDEQKQVKTNLRLIVSEQSSWEDKLKEAKRSADNMALELQTILSKQKHRTDNINQLNAEIESIKEKVFDEAFELIDGAYKDNARKKKTTEEEIKASEYAIDSLESTLAEMHNNSDKSLIASLEESLKQYRLKASSVLENKTKIETELHVLKEQEQYFLEFKTYLANTKIEALSRITNDFLISIGSDIQIKLSGYTLLKSGKIRDKISISLIRAGVDCGSFGKFSAGEAARVNLATILAMQKLVNSNCELDKGLDLLVLDEILEAVDEDGLSYMFMALNKLQITALIVSHGNIAESYPYKIKIIKENGDSRIDNQ